MSNLFCINKSGGNCPVYDRAEYSGAGRKKIGSIYNREAFGYDQDWGGDGVFNHIIFRNSSGQLAWGFLEPEYVENYPETITYCEDYPFGTATIKGSRYITFKFRRAEKIYKSDGSSWGTVASGQRVACLNSFSGSSNPHWKGINYVEKTDGTWVKVSGAGYDFGFVNTGLDKGSSPTNISMYGNW